ncbi:hypothetical protein D7Z54_18015 [Salibacterium salarium]|uniref:GP-PDE domain-containing protein n=1 Tax=Salibacterium salarium TaxID=284579 RepID=A0A3R9QJR4_9BACI|nr:glycerophosphodiester phosphodiesterase family protein [Salibacterium salarium]RSL31969.1 hypothetical protein D7Z54_18015 [Salibacterium salarium]
MAVSFDSYVMIIAHRGSTTPSIKENTIEAFQLSMDEGADMIETDIRSTKDKKLVCSHNAVWRGQNKKYDVRRMESQNDKERRMVSISFVRSFCCVG